MMAAALEKLSILVVDDNSDMRALLRRLLNAGGVRQVYEAEDGASGLALLRDNACDIVLTDLSMAPMDGIAFTRALRSARDTLDPQLPVIMISGHTERHRVEAARDAGVTEFLVKPITPRNLFGRIDDIMERPRAFVRAEDYFGPDRRRKRSPVYKGPFRRSGDSR